MASTAWSSTTTCSAAPCDERPTGPTEPSEARCVATTYPSKLVPCEFCKRTFHPERLETHQRVCGLVESSGIVGQLEENMLVLSLNHWGFGWMNWWGVGLSFAQGITRIMQSSSVWPSILPYVNHESIRLPSISKIQAS